MRGIYTSDLAANSLRGQKRGINTSDLTAIGLRSQKRGINTSDLAANSLRSQKRGINTSDLAATGLRGQMRGINTLFDLRNRFICPNKGVSCPNCWQANGGGKTSFLEHGATDCTRLPKDKYGYVYRIILRIQYKIVKYCVPFSAVLSGQIMKRICLEGVLSITGWK